MSGMDLGQIDMLRKGDLARGQATSMTAMREDAAGGGWHRLSVLILAVVVIGLPINNAVDYAAVLAVVLGLYPEAILGVLRASVTQLLTSVASGEVAGNP